MHDSFAANLAETIESVARIFPLTLQAPVVIKVESHLVAVVVRQHGMNLES